MPSRGEVWMVDLGMAAKVRPALILNQPFTDAAGLAPASMSKVEGCT